MPWVFGLGNAVGIRSGRRRPTGSGSFIIERFVWPQLVVRFSKAVEDTLLEIEVGRRGTGHAFFEGFVESLMSAVFLRTAGMDALVSDAELEPPNVEVVETMDAAGCEGSPIVGADRLGEAAGAEQAVEMGFYPFATYVVQALTGEKIAREMIDNGEGVAVDAIAHPKLALEINGPDLVRAGGAQGNGARVPPLSATAAMVNMTVAREDVADSAPGRPGALGIASAKTLEYLAGSPTEAAMFFENEADDIAGRLVRYYAGGSTAVEQPARSLVPVALEPLVPGVPADAIS
jgi:hypothetical protein